MTHRPPFRRADGQVALPGVAVQRLWLLPLAVIVLLLCMWLIAGPLLPLVLATLLNGIWAVLVLVPATMFGVLLTVALERRGSFAGMAYPSLYRLVLSAALGLGAFSLAMLLLGALDLLATPAPAALPLLAVVAGYLPTRKLVARANLRAPLEKFRPRDFLALLACAPLATLAVATTFPAGTLWSSEGRGYDVQEYHLALPRIYSALGTAAPVHGNIYSWLPLNTEMLYTLLAGLTRLASGAGYLYALVYSAPLLHAMVTLLAAAAVALVPVALPPLARLAAFLLAIGLPWVLVIGSLAYNDGSVLLYGALSIGLALSAAGPAAAVVLGCLLGLAVGTKMTAGVMVALPVAAMLAARQRFRELLLATLVALGLYCPWMARSMAFSHTRHSVGNPVFPIAAKTLGMGRWSPRLASRFDRGHAAPPRYAAFPTRFTALARQSVLYPQWSFGIAAIAALLHAHPMGGAWPLRVGLAWLVLLPAALFAAYAGGSRAWLLWLCLLVQLACWMLFTQLQSRFLVPAIIPLALLAAVAIAARPAWRFPIFGAAAFQCAACLFLLLPEAGLLLGPRFPGTPIGLLPRFPDDWIVSPVTPAQLPPHITTYLEGYDCTLYIHGRAITNTVFNRNLLGRALRRHGPGGGMRYLRKAGVNLLVVDWPEVARLRATYGFSSAITRRAIHSMLSYGLKPAPWPCAPGISMYIINAAPFPSLHALQGVHHGT